MNANLDKLTSVITGILGIDARELSDGKKVSEIPNWDSFNNLQIIASVEEAFGIQFTTEEIVKAVTYGDVKGLVTKKGVALE